MADSMQKKLKVFGYGLAVISLVIALRGFWKYGLTPGFLLFIILSIGFSIVTAVNVFVLQGFYGVWMKVAGLLGHLISTVVLVVLFYTVFGIVGIVLRVLGKDLLDLKSNKDQKSYWTAVEKVSFDKKRYRDQF